MATPQAPKEPQRFVERRAESPADEVSELAVWRARQKFALTLGGVAIAVLLVGGIMALLLLREWRTPIAQTPSLLPTKGNIARVPATPPPPANPMVTTPAPLPSPPTTAVKPPEPTPKPSVPEPPPQPAPTPTQPAQPPPKAVLDYLEQLRRIELQRKQTARTLWPAVVALLDAVKAMQGVAATGDILESPSQYDPQKTLQTFDAYQTSFARLRQWLHQLQPPPECVALHNAYDAALNAHITVIGNLRERVRMKDLAGVALSGLSAQGQVSSALQAADGELASVCARYNITKFFTIGDE